MSDLVSMVRNIEGKLFGVDGKPLRPRRGNHVASKGIDGEGKSVVFTSCLDGNEDIFGGVKSDTNVSLVTPLLSGDLDAIC